MCRSDRVDMRALGAPKATANLAPFTDAKDQEFRWMTGGGDWNGENDAVNTTDKLFRCFLRAPYALLTQSSNSLSEHRPLNFPFPVAP